MDRTNGLLRFVGDYQAPLIATAITAAFSLLLLAVISLGLPIWFLVLVVAVIVYAFTVLHRPVVGLYFVVAVFFVPIKLSFGLSLLQSVGGGTAALLLLWFLYQNHRIVLGSYMIPPFLLGPLFLVSFLYTHDAARTLDAFRHWAFNMMFVLLLLNLVTTFKTFKKILWAIMIMASANSIVAMIDSSAASHYAHRAAGMMRNPNALAHLAALAFPLALYQYMFAKGWVRWFSLALCAVLAGGIVVSVSRGALISVLFVFFAVVIRERRRLIPLLFVAGLAFSAIPLVPEYYFVRVGNLATDAKYSLALGNDRQLTDRGHLNAAGLRIWAAHPIMGVGIGNFGYYYVRPEFRGGMLAKQSIVAHNVYIQALSETGIVGTSIFFWMLINSVLSLLRAGRAVKRTDKRWVYFGGVEMMTLAVLISTGVVGNMVGSNLWLFLGLTMVADKVANNKEEP
jgi:O-antigen ligase